MRISTKSSLQTQNRNGGQLPLMKAPVRKKNSQKVVKNHMTVRRIMATVRIVGTLAGVLFIAVFIFSIGKHVYNSDMFRLRSVTVYGCKEIDPAKLGEIVKEIIPGNILDIKLETLKERLEQEKWVKNVEIRRVLPSGLIIHVQERAPSVILEISGRLMITDDDGILLDRYDPHYGRLDVPVFRGAIGQDTGSYNDYLQENSARIRRALDMLAEINSGGSQYLQKISEIDISDPNNLKVILVDDNIEIHLGKENYLNRLQTFFANKDIYEETKKKYGDIVAVDLHFDNLIRYELNANVSGSSEGRIIDSHPQTGF